MSRIQFAPGIRSRAFLFLPGMPCRLRVSTHKTCDHGSLFVQLFSSKLAENVQFITVACSILSMWVVQMFSSKPVGLLKFFSFG